MRAPFLASLLSVSCLLPALATAQFGQQPPAPQATLDPAATATIDRLGSLGSFPAVEWRFHPADIAHGEDPKLDDSSWSVAKTPRNTTDHEAIWYRARLTVPKTLNGYDLAGTRIWIRFDVGANGPMPEILYFDGRRVALGEDLEQTVLFENAKPGDSVLVAVKLLHTNDDKTFNGVKMHIDMAPGRPNPLDLRTQFEVAQKLLPWVGDHHGTADPGNLSTLNSAIKAVDLSALDKSDQTAFDASLTKSLSLLEPLRPILQKDTLHMTGNSHIDAAWLWPESETIDVVRRTFSTALQLMNEYPDYTYTQSAAQYNEWMADKYPAMDAEIKQRIKEGRWEVVGGMWVEPDLNLPDGESQVRSLLLGKRWFKQHYGVDVRIGWNPDSFGYNWQLPQIYKRSGVDYFVTQKMTWNDTNQLPFKLFWWQSPDGSKVLSYFPHDYSNDNLDPVRLSGDLAVARERAPGMTTMMDLYGIGDHGGGPTRTILDQGEHWAHADNAVTPQMHFGLAQTFFTAAEQTIAAESKTWNYQSIAKGYNFPTPEAGKMVIPTWKDEMYFEYHRGVQTTQAQHKRNMREAEENTLNAEKLSSIAWLYGDAYPNAQFTDAWKKIAFNGFHDLAAGSGIGIIYKDAQKEFDMVRLEDAEAAQHALNSIAARIDTGEEPGTPVLVTNPLAWPRDGLVRLEVQLPKPDGEPSVRDANGNVLTSQIIAADPKTNRFTLEVLTNKTPSMGYQVLHVTTAEHLAGVGYAATSSKLENGNLRVAVDPTTGCITSLVNKKSNFEAIAPKSCGNQLQAFKDTPKDYDAWNIDYGTFDHPMPIDKVDSIKLIESGPVRSTIRIERTWQSSHFTQDISLAANADTVVIDNTVDWHETHILLKAAFPLAASGPMATFEIPYGTIQRPTTRNNSWESAKFEVPALRWADLSDAHNGFSLLNEEKYGYDAIGNTLRLSLLRSPTWPDPEADRGIQHFRYALYPHAGTWQQAMTERKGYELNYPLQASVVEAHMGSLASSHSFVSVDDDNVILTAIKKSEDTNSLILRVYDWSGKSSSAKFTLPPGATSATEVNLMEQPIGESISVTNNTATLPVGPFEIKTLRVDYPH
ncbi:alpha-mannosidase [Granulicella aggregans]|uniref:Alpha-mannosidase n=1 Tax=Granulicella aggregans TaxID=474949 RepID=A0A7W8E5D5_9BACT|nr:glycoside hydrolase family 38 C-terminal domain-containing protein [Granulicella aggregans]MBB5059973.1 alpha-mannosidase [Granulicella aggregans]